MLVDVVTQLARRSTGLHHVQLALQDLKHRLQEDYDHWANQQTNGAERRNAAQDTQQCQQRVKLGLTMQNEWLDKIVDHGHDDGTENRQPNGRRDMLLDEKEIQRARHPNRSRADEWNERQSRRQQGQQDDRLESAKVVANSSQQSLGQRRQQRRQYDGSTDFSKLSRSSSKCRDTS